MPLRWPDVSIDRPEGQAVGPACWSARWTHVATTWAASISLFRSSTHGRSAADGWSGRHQPWPSRRTGTRHPSWSKRATAPVQSAPSSPTGACSGRSLVPGRPSGSHRRMCWPSPTASGCRAGRHRQQRSEHGSPVSVPSIEAARAWLGHSCGDQRGVHGTRLERDRPDPRAGPSVPARRDRPAHHGDVDATPRSVSFRSLSRPSPAPLCTLGEGQPW